MTEKITLPSRRIIFPLLLSLTVMIFMTGCTKGPEDKAINPDPRFSVNVMPVPEFWPREKKDFPKEKEKPELKNAMMKAWREYGTPDYFRRVYTADRRIVRRNELREDMPLRGRIAERDEWVYLEEKLVLEFDGPKIKEHELGDILRTVCLYGDPNTIRDHKTAEGDLNKIYTYYEHGTFTFYDGKLIDESTFFTTQSDTSLLRD